MGASFFLGEPFVTEGGLIFIGATADETFRVFDKETGGKLAIHLSCCSHIRLSRIRVEGFCSTDSISTTAEKRLNPRQELLSKTWSSKTSDREEITTR